MEYYTIKDIKLMTGLNNQEISVLINILNKEIIDDNKDNDIKPVIFDNKILKEYFMKRVEIEL